MKNYKGNYTKVVANKPHHLQTTGLLTIVPLVTLGTQTRTLHPPRHPHLLHLPGIAATLQHLVEVRKPN